MAIAIRQSRFLPPTMSLAGFLEEPAPLLLDAYPGALNAYSFRKLSEAYAGSAVRIRRSSDNAEADIGFSGTEFNTAAAAAHIGGGSGFIVTMYDQTGNGYDITQATAANQPAYSATGLNGLPTGSWDGGNVAIRSGDFPTAGSNVVTSAIVATIANTGSNFGRLWSYGNTTSDPDWNNVYSCNAARDNGQAKVTGASSNSTGPTSSNVVYGTPFVCIGRIDGTDITHFLNGTESAGPAAFSTLDLGGNNGDVSRFGLRCQAVNLADTGAGVCSEFVGWLSAQSDGDIAAISANQQAYWGI
jgi:hypothetical protein